MKTILGIFGAIVVVGLILYLSLGGFYNKGITYRAKAKTAWSDVEAAYQRRYDLIPNLVSTVKGYAEHEKSTLEAVIKARNSATQVKIDPANATPEQMAKFQQAQQGFSNAFRGQIKILFERYPDLKANKNFLELQSQWEGTENRIEVARKRFNKAVEKFNIHIQHFPGNMLAGMFGFKEMVRFKADKGAAKAPKYDSAK